MRQATLCLLIKEINGKKELLLAMKKKGFGRGKWNGIGGKFDPKTDKDIFDTAKRELKEEIGIEANELEKVALLSFYFPYQEDWNQDVHVFFVRNWQGLPVESDEMKPQWFKIGEIPFGDMWSDDIIWLPRVLDGEKIKANFVFKFGETVDTYDIKAA